MSRGGGAPSSAARRRVEAADVGVVADEPAVVVEPEDVHRAHAARERRQRVARANMRSLCGMVTLPAARSRRSSRATSSKRRRLDVERLVRERDAAAASAALCNRGDNECATGWPSSTSRPGAVPAGWSAIRLTIVRAGAALRRRCDRARGGSPPRARPPWRGRRRARRRSGR